MSANDSNGTPEIDLEKAINPDLPVATAAQIAVACGYGAKHTSRAYNAGRELGIEPLEGMPSRTYLRADAIRIGEHLCKKRREAEERNKAPRQNRMRNAREVQAAQRAGAHAPLERLLWTREDLAAVMQISPNSVDVLREREDFPAPVALGLGVVRWRAEDVRGWLSGLRNETPTATTVQVGTPDIQAQFGRPSTKD